MLLQFRIGALALAFVAGADFCVGLYCLVLDEVVKDRRLVRTKPYQMDLDDALALTDDDALARDMFARSSQKDGRSFYMEASQPHAHLCLAHQDHPIMVFSVSWQFSSSSLN